MDTSYDVVLVGAGLSQSILTAMLADQQRKKVLLLSPSSSFDPCNPTLTKRNLESFLLSERSPVELPDILQPYNPQSGESDSMFSFLTEFSPSFFNFSVISEASSRPDRISFQPAPHLVLAKDSLMCLVNQAKIFGYFSFLPTSPVRVLNRENISQVLPQSKGDIFRSDLPLFTKRQLIMFLKMCAERIEDESLLENVTVFQELPESVVHGLKAMSLSVQYPISTLGHLCSGIQTYGASLAAHTSFPFLAPKYGSGDFADAFATHAGCWDAHTVLNLTAQGVSVSGDGRFAVNFNSSQSISCDVVCVAASFVPPDVLLGLGFYRSEFNHLVTVSTVPFSQLQLPDKCFQGVWYVPDIEGFAFVHPPETCIFEGHHVFHAVTASSDIDLVTRFGSLFSDETWTFVYSHSAWSPPPDKEWPLKLDVAEGKHILVFPSIAPCFHSESLAAASINGFREIMGSEALLFHRKKFLDDRASLFDLPEGL